MCIYTRGSSSYSVEMSDSQIVLVPALFEIHLNNSITFGGGYGSVVMVEYKSNVTLKL